MVPENDLAEIVVHSKNSLLELEGSKIVILGGTGFIGKWLLSTLNFAKEVLNLRYDVCVVTRSTDRAKREFRKSKIEFIQHDLSQSLLDLPYADFYIHAATPSVPSRGSKDPFLVANSTLNGSISIFNAVVKSKSTRSILYLSSGAVYGKQSLNQSFLEEGVATIPNSTLGLYGHTKLIGESIFAQIHLDTGIPISTPRLFAFLGPHISLNDHFAIGNFLRDAREKKQISISGNPNTVRSYLYPTDLLINLLQLIVKPQRKPINIGSALPYTMLEVAEQLSVMFGNLPIEILGANKEISRYVPEIDWMLNEGFTQKVGIIEGLSRWDSWLNQASMANQGGGF